jgi:hypothetical protein
MPIVMAMKNSVYRKMKIAVAIVKTAASALGAIITTTVLIPYHVSIIDAP